MMSNNDPGILIKNFLESDIRRVTAIKIPAMYNNFPYLIFNLILGGNKNNINEILKRIGNKPQLVRKILIISSPSYLSMYSIGIRLRPVTRVTPKALKTNNPINSVVKKKYLSPLIVNT